MQGLFKLDKENKTFYKLLISLCIPMIIQNLISSSVNVIDTVMISSLGESSVASIGVANQFFFLFNMTLYGITGGAGIFISQFFGKKDINNIRSVTGLSTILAFIVSCLFFLPALVSPKLIINIFSNDTEVIKLCIQYFSIIAFSYPIIAVSTVFSMGARGVRNPKLGMICSTIALGTNIILNYGLILGNFGLPALGVKGAAIATVIARIIELVLIVSYVYFIKKDYVLRFNLSDVKRIKSEFLKTFISKSLPIFLNDSLWAFGTVLYSVAYSKAGTSAIAASQIATSTGNFFIMTSVCIANGAAIMLGNELGADHIDKAIRYSKKFSILVTLTGLLFGILLIVNIPLLLKVFNVSKSLSPDIIKIFVIMGILMALKSFNTFIVIGVLRSGGDTKYSLFLELGCMWLVSLPLTFLAAFNGAPIFMLVLLTYTEEIAKFLFGVPRALSKKWATNLVKEIV
ncbi:MULTISPECIES: MATE family efflux transporter [unclassified Romboutsia]|uniref:MATE family efflux transporter n=1 Tax=unclassified Romboutsia TaxID=2626894 RepID=UPI0008220903|nr:MULTISPECIES: MATE family efflux transporter [unclassified Romboutsia]SCI34320.1 Multidrug-efflux transporter [uncultured Clostridium sp.]